MSRRWLTLLAVLLASCAMDREQVLEKKLCDPDGECARGYRCRDGTCVAATANNGNALSFGDAGSSDSATGRSE